MEKRKKWVVNVGKRKKVDVGVGKDDSKGRGKGGKGKKEEPPLTRAELMDNAAMQAREEIGAEDWWRSVGEERRGLRGLIEEVVRGMSSVRHK